MTDPHQVLGFTYFSSPEFLLGKKIKTWLPALRDLSAGVVIFKANFNHVIPEDVFLSAKENQLTPIIHFASELPLARRFNEMAFLLDIYAKWGVDKVILGDRPNMKGSWPISGWHYENLIGHFLDRFIPLAAHAVRIGMRPVLSPLQPGGDYWDTAFVEMVLQDLLQRKLPEVMENLILSCYGYTFNKALDWGSGGPERWSASKPYRTPEGQEDQLGFHNYEWIQAIGEKASGREYPIIILDAGNPGIRYSQMEPGKIYQDLRQIIDLCSHHNSGGEIETESAQDVPGGLRFLTFALDTIDEIANQPLNPNNLLRLFKNSGMGKSVKDAEPGCQKAIKHYLLLPSYGSTVSDAILNKVRPLIKKFKPTIGFSIQEAEMAEKVSVYPDTMLFTDERLNQLRGSGCVVDILPESGIEIATRVHDIDKGN